MPLETLLASLPRKHHDGVAPAPARSRVDFAVSAVESLPLTPMELMQVGLRIFDKALNDGSVKACLRFIQMHHPTPAESIDIEDGVHRMRDEQDESLESTNADAA